MKRLLPLFVFGLLAVFLISNVAFAESSPSAFWTLPLKALYGLTIVPAGVVLSPFVCPAVYILNQDASIPDTFGNYYAKLLSPIVTVQVKEDRYRRAVEGKLWKERLQEEERLKEQAAKTGGADLPETGPLTSEEK